MSTFVHKHIACYVCRVIFSSTKLVQNKNATQMFDTDVDWADAIVAAFFPEAKPQPSPAETTTPPPELESV
jgi:hypothetical protein